MRAHSKQSLDPSPLLKTETQTGPLTMWLRGQWTRGASSTKGGKQKKRLARANRNIFWSKLRRKASKWALVPPLRRGHALIHEAPLYESQILRYLLTCLPIPANSRLDHCVAFSRVLNFLELRVELGNLALHLVRHHAPQPSRFLSTSRSRYYPASDCHLHKVTLTVLN